MQLLRVRMQLQLGNRDLFIYVEKVKILRNNMINWSDKQ